MRKVGGVVFLVAFLAAVSAAMGLVTRWHGGTWTVAWRSAGGWFAVSLLWVAAALIPKSSPWSRRATRLRFVGTAAGSGALVAGAAGAPYRLAGVATLALLVAELWSIYKTTADYLERKDAGPMRLFEWLVFFKDPDGLDVKTPPDAERAEPLR
jgi:MFS family permease